MFLRPKESLRLSIYSMRCIGFSNRRDFHLTHCAYLRNVSAGRRRAAEVRDSESTPTVAGELSVSVPPKKVNDNFFGIESDEGVIEINGKDSLKNDARSRLFKNVEQEKFISTSYGTVRYDSENKPKYHGQLEKEKILVSSNVDKTKLHGLNQILQKKNSVEKSDELCTEKSSKTTTDVLDRNLKSVSSSYVDELYFPETYTGEGNISKMEGTSSSSNDKLNFIEESYFSDKIAPEYIFKDPKITSGDIYFTDKNYPLSDQEESIEKIANHKLSDFQSMSELKSSPSALDSKSNFIEKSYFNKIADESISKYVNMTSENISCTDQKQPFLVNEKTEYISQDEKSNSYSSNVEFSTENLFNTGETEQNLKALNNLNESIEKVDADDKGEQISLEWNTPSLEDLESNDKFMPNAANLPKKKNHFLFQSKEFLKSQQTNSKNLSNEKKLRLFKRNLDETDAAENIQNKEEVTKSSLEKKNLKVKKENSKTKEELETAYDFVKKLRNTNKLDPELINGKFIQKKELYDSKGFRILKNQVPDLSNYTRDEILDLLVKNVIYSDDDLVVLNKPYNLVMHKSKTAKDPSLSQYLDDLAAELDKETFKPKLITVHRLDKETCGCLLLARNEMSAQRLLSFFSQRKIIKTYWIVTTKVPDPLEGVIDMPISEGSVNGRSRMVLHPDLPNDILYKNHSKSGKRAVTHYKVIAESGNAALVEAKPETGIKHQIRVHFGFGLSCPILGDHKYSHLDKLAPQKLQADLLQRLCVQQSKVRYIPMHIYARSIFIPQYKDGKNLFVMAPMPIHISKNLQKLKFRKK